MTLEEKRAAMKQAVIDLIHAEYPNLKIVDRHEAPFAKLMEPIFKMIGWERFVFTIPPWRMFLTPSTSWRTIAHEYVHVWDFKRAPVRYALAYTFPRNLALLAPLGLIGLIWTPWAWLSLLMLLSLAPWPSPGRVHYEGRAYEMSRLAATWETGRDVDREIYRKYFTGLAYYFMSWGDGWKDEMNWDTPHYRILQKWKEINGGAGVFVEKP